MSNAALPLPALGRPGPIVPRALMSDQRLADLAAGGDERAFSTLYERHYEGLYRYVLSLLHSEADAHDALQTTMMNALLALPAKKKEAPLKPWLYRIAHNESVSIHRRRRDHADLSVDEETSNGSGNPYEDVALREDLKQLVADVLDLPDRQRGVLIMRELNGLEYAEIATAFDVSPGAARQLVYEARAALHEREQGRELACRTVQRTLSSGDRRVMRGRRLRAHLRGCGECRDFDAMMNRRRAGLEALVPALPGVSLLALIKGLFTGGGSGGAGGGVAGGGAIGGAAAGGTVAIPAAVKATLLAVAVVGGTIPALNSVVPFSSENGPAVRDRTDAGVTRVLSRSTPPLFDPRALKLRGEAGRSRLRPVGSVPSAPAGDPGSRRLAAVEAPAGGHAEGHHAPTPQEVAGRQEVGGTPDEHHGKKKADRGPAPVAPVPAPVPSPVTQEQQALEVPRTPGTGETPPGHADLPKPGKKPHPHGGPPGLLKP